MILIYPPAITIPLPPFPTPQLIGQHVVAMLNSNGGILAFGVRQTGVIYGEVINRWEEDLLKRTIDETVKRISPCVRYDQYVVKFTPVCGSHFMDYSQQTRYVLEIKVKGDSYELYEDQNHEVGMLSVSDVCLCM